MAWKLAESKESDTPDINAGDLVNVYVVDHEDNPVKYYATGQFEVFNQINIEGWTDKGGNFIKPNIQAYIR